MVAVRPGGAFAPGAPAPTTVLDMLHAWRAAGANDSWLASAGIAGSMAVGAIVIGYYLSYSAGVRWRLRKVS